MRNEEKKTIITTEELVKKIHQLEARVEKLEAQHYHKSTPKSTPSELMERWEKVKEESLAYSGEEWLEFLYKALEQFTSDEIGEIARTVSASETNQVKDSTDDPMSPDELREWWENLTNGLRNTAKDDRVAYCNEQLRKLSMTNIINLYLELGLK